MTKKRSHINGERGGTRTLDPMIKNHLLPSGPPHSYPTEIAHLDARKRHWMPAKVTVSIEYFCEITALITAGSRVHDNQTRYGSSSLGIAEGGYHLQGP